MRTFAPTAEQNDIISAAVSTKDNLAVVARAGAAKTTTLVMIAEALPEEQILCLAFNKKIADEMNDRLPANCEAKTLHGLGFAAWSRFIPGRCKLNKNKVYQILRTHFNEIEDQKEREEAFEVFYETVEMVGAAKQVGYIPSSYKGHWKSHCSDEDFFGSLPKEPTNFQEDAVKHALVQSFKAALKGEIDFDDMIYCPALCSVSWPSFPVTLIDEAQDLSALNHYILRKMVKKRRLIAVGDPLQAIYGFRGASVESMNEMIEMFSMTSLYLTCSFRCGRLITEWAHWIAPDMKSPDWAIEGEVTEYYTWTADQLEYGDAIICRNNAPLFSLAMKLIEAGKLPEIAGRDVGLPIIKIMKTLGKPTMLSLAAVEAVTDWEERELRRSRAGAKGQVRDKAAIMLMMIRKAINLEGAIDYLEALLARKGRIHLMTGHKSKGLEFDRVWFLDKHLCDIKKGQDANLRYVIQTRAKAFLGYITSEGYDDGKESEDANL
jgi:DNA helicase-2/ATP-dependent DNA helicase PcrA